MKTNTAVWGISIMLGLSPLPASEWSGYAAFEWRVFERSPLWEGQDGDASMAAIIEPEFFYDWDDGDQAVELAAYVRQDSQDGERDLLDLREFSYLSVRENWEFRLGISKVFWGVTESQHLVDVINQTDLAANADGEDKLGQPMLQVARVTPFGDFEAFLLPGFRERTFPGIDGRLRSPIPVDTDRPLYESSAGDGHLDGALRWFSVVGDFDVGLHYFRGTRRDPLFLADLDSSGGPVLRPYYEQMDQVGLDLQYTRGGWLIKFEGIGREAASGEHSAAAGGFEYTLYGVAGSAIDAGLLVEGHFDSRGSRAPAALNRDLFLGTRLTWNDRADTSLILGGFFDLDNDSLLGRVEFERRLGNRYKLEIEAQKLANLAIGDPFYALRRDSYVQLGLSWHW